VGIHSTAAAVQVRKTCPAAYSVSGDIATLMVLREAGRTPFAKQSKPRSLYCVCTPQRPTALSESKQGWSPVVLSLDWHSETGKNVPVPFGVRFLWLGLKTCRWCGGAGHKALQAVPMSDQEVYICPPVLFSPSEIAETRPSG